MRVLLFGYQAIGAACLRVLCECPPPADIAGLVTHEDDPDEDIWFDTPAPLARDRNIPILTPSKREIRSRAFLETVRELAPELIISAYYRYMIPVSVLDAAPLGGINLHGSLLPQFRGRCPVNWMILEGAVFGGVTLHTMVREPDAGDILAQSSVPIAPRDTARTLYAKLVPAAETLLRETWPRIAAGDVSGRPQDHSRATYFGGRRPGDGRIDWSAGAPAADRLIRAVTHPYPGAFTFWRGRRLFIWEALPAKGRESLAPGTVWLSWHRIFIDDGNAAALSVVRLQLEGEEELGGARFLARHRDFDGARLGGPA